MSEGVSHMSVTELVPSADRAGPKSELERLCQGAMLLFLHVSAQASIPIGRMDTRLSSKVPPSAVRASWARRNARNACGRTLS